MAGTADASGDRAVAAGGNIGRVITGDFVTQVENGVLLPAESLSIPESGLVHLPERTALFVGRSEEMAALDAGTPSGIQVLCGLGGIGKSTLAAHWAAERIDGHHPIWWITAETPAALTAGLAALARAMQPAYVGVLADDALWERALHWLATHEGWLLVLDNVADPADLRPLLARIRPTGRSRILVTSRRATGWQDLAQTVAVPELGPEEAAALFAQVCPGDGVAEVCEELGRLPLALRQAAAYCAEAGITPRAYLELLRDHPAETFALTAEGGEAGRTVARVWQVTLERLADTPLASLMLGVLAWWAPEGVPRNLLAPLGTPLEVTEAIRRLRAHSMITLDGAGIGVHRVVQAVVRVGGPDEHRERAVALLQRAASASWSLSLDEILEDHGAWAAIAAQAEALARHTEPRADILAQAFVFEWAGQMSALVGDAQGFPLIDRAVAAYTRLLGADHEATLQARRLLANVTRMNPVFKESPATVRIMEDNLALYLQAYGPDDARTLTARSQLADLLAESSPERAGELLRENVERATRAFGENAPQTLEARCALIETESDLSVACLELERLLDRARSFQPEGSALFRNVEMALIKALARAGRSERALELAERGVETTREQFGPRNPMTLASIGSFALLLIWIGDADRGRELVWELLPDWQDVMGETLYTRLFRKLVEEPPT
ncbi:tetratricopeptide repeat protein [Streptomyces sp. NPDC004291]